MNLPEICPCCCCLRQEDLGFRTSLDQIDTLGEAANLVFLNHKYGAAMMASAFIIFGVYSLVTNIIASSSVLS
jgi:hypothetical protein